MPRAAAVALVMLLASCGSDRDPLVEASKAALDDNSKFVSARLAGQTYADIAATLLESTKRCVADRRDDDARCTTRAASAAFFQVLSDEVVECDLAGVRQSRRVARITVENVVDADRAKGERPAPSPPGLPRC